LPNLSQRNCRQGKTEKRRQSEPTSGFFNEALAADAKKRAEELPSGTSYLLIDGTR